MAGQEITLARDPALAPDRSDADDNGKRPDATSWWVEWKGEQVSPTYTSKAQAKEAAERLVYAARAMASAPGQDPRQLRSLLAARPERIGAIPWPPPPKQPRDAHHAWAGSITTHVGQGG